MGYIRSAKQDCATGPEQAMHAIAHIALQQVFTGHGVMPAVTGTSGTSANWPQPGAQREVAFSDGSHARETVTQFGLPFFSYTVQFERGPFARLVERIEGHWSFTPRDDGSTTIRWEYEFFPRSKLASPVLKFVTACLWPGYMRRALSNCVASAQAQ